MTGQFWDLEDQGACGCHFLIAVVVVGVEN